MSYLIFHETPPATWAWRWKTSEEPNTSTEWCYLLPVDRWNASEEMVACLKYHAGKRIGELKMKVREWKITRYEWKLNEYVVIRIKEKWSHVEEIADITEKREKKTKPQETTYLAWLMSQFFFRHRVIFFRHNAQQSPPQKKIKVIFFRHSAQQNL